MTTLTLEDINARQIEEYVTWVYNENVGHGEIEPYTHSNDELAPTCSNCGTLVSPHADSVNDWDWWISHGREIQIDDGICSYQYSKTPICKGCVDTVESGWGGFSTQEGGDEVAVGQLDQKPSEMVLELGKVQRAVLLAMSDLHDGSHPNEYRGWTKRVDVTRWIASAEYYTAPSANSISAGVSRAVHSLIDRGLLTGAYRAWHTYHGDSPPKNAGKEQSWSGYQGEHPSDHNQNDNPTLEKLRLRGAGLRAGALISDVVNGGGDE